MTPCLNSFVSGSCDDLHMIELEICEVVHCIVDRRLDCASDDLTPALNN
jgi:hypothetical protein